MLDYVLHEDCAIPVAFCLSRETFEKWPTLH